ncbi:hypothetical protein E2C01_010572 [Portunus trituberculatus]|uniref:Uncharacterized protein n=1 Tax=Portunus trituberculatus TaxID=210409 RepID=A0A5B7D8T5_PORTR|nr:hypothetical protein [Portunus trituberculatus]
MSPLTGPEILILRFKFFFPIGVQAAFTLALRKHCDGKYVVFCFLGGRQIHRKTNRLNKEII